MITLFTHTQSCLSSSSTISTKGLVIQRLVCVCVILSSMKSLLWISVMTRERWWWNQLETESESSCQEVVVVVSLCFLGCQRSSVYPCLITTIRVWDTHTHTSVGINYYSVYPSNQSKDIQRLYKQEMTSTESMWQYMEEYLFPTDTHTHTHNQNSRLYW